MSDDSIAIHLRDLAEPLVTAWRRELAGVARVTVSCGEGEALARPLFAPARDVRGAHRA
jgi:hypothetical protein